MPKGDLMNCTTPKKRKSAQTIIASLFIFSTFAGMLSSCNAIAKTPISTEGVNYELTPTVENSEMEELTLVPETEAVTATQIWTLTTDPSLTVTATATETPRPTEVEKYPIDLEKLRNFPQSYEYLVAHPEEFVETPDGVDDPQALLDWYYNKLVPVMGDQTKLEPTLNITNITEYNGLIAIAIIPEHRQTLMRNPDFFLFQTRRRVVSGASVNFN
jgi:hypothetical protein